MIFRYLYYCRVTQPYGTCTVLSYTYVDDGTAAPDLA